ncbi:galactokinase [Puniceicoccales bacterium CK1056]|uniref:Galactokinase n=1 Tax=Oceanipulchritudo coccoides TaxID=2706888 RepID=A0A6B2LZV6_9BACT|nr:galactokinase [Oceanipulchritudo coccoides]NDV61464.1 galactokinase [Oceanipulchritudo coccoides]
MKIPQSAEGLIDNVREQFKMNFGDDAEIVAFAPGRVNVIGEHVDYNGGWVLPAAIDRFLVMAVKARSGKEVRLATATYDGRVEFTLDEIAPGRSRGWDRYVRGVLAGIIGAGNDLTGFDACFDSNIPIGGGLSSSAAFEAATGLAALALCGGEMDRFELAKLCQHAEHEYAGVPCGIMDQAAVLNCKAGHLLFLDCENETFEQAPFKADGWRLMIINSGVAHELADGEYAKRRKACHDAAEIIGVSSLRHIAIEELDATLANESLNEEMRKCVRHNVTENDRTHKAVAALAAGDIEEAGKQMNLSHASLRDDYRVSCDELDYIAEIAQPLEGVAGCRMTGGGFGGSCIALVREEVAENVSTLISTAFSTRFKHAPKIFLTTPETSAHAFKTGV